MTPGASGIAVDLPINGIRIRARVDGADNAPWLLLANPLGANLTIWDDVVRAYGGRFRMLRYDQRGHGGTELPATTSMDLLIADALGLLDACGIEQAALTGVSMGAATVLGLTARHPDRVTRVVASDGQWASPAGATELWDTRIADAEVTGMGALADATIQRWFTPAFLATHPPVVESVRQMIRDTSLDGYAACARALTAYDLRAEISRITQPALLIVGAADGALPKTMREMHAAIAGSQFVEIAGAGHLPHIEQPEAFHRAVDPFLFA